MREANLSVQGTALCIWEKRKLYSGDPGWRFWGYGTSSEEKRAVGAAVLQDGSCLHQEGYFLEVCLFWDEGLCPTCSGHKLPAMDFNMNNNGRQDFCVMTLDNVLF